MRVKTHRPRGAVPKTSVATNKAAAENIQSH